MIDHQTQHSTKAKEHIQKKCEVRANVASLIWKTSGNTSVVELNIQVKKA